MDRRSLLRLAGGLSLAGALGACSSPKGDRPLPKTPQVTQTPAPEQRVQNVSKIDGVIISKYLRGEPAPWVVLFPPGYSRGARIPVLLTLHGTGGDQGTPWILRWPETSAQLQAEGLPAFACVGIKGGDRWWHPRADGTDSAALVTDEFATVLRGLGLDMSRPAVYGYSMGGVGALYLGAMLGRHRVSSVVAASTPFIPSFAESQGAYDTQTDFNQHNIRSLWPRLQGLPVRIDIGDRDPFLSMNRDFIPTAQPAPEFHINPGGHDAEYWGRMALDQLRFVARHF
ncbi:alpha/beta hydrolase [Arsenicicoccus cauae]|nr:alpha/beta hydrolase-fold protein [Arsenicicoccus cauae]